MTNLFQWGSFRLHSGQASNFKIDCDALTKEDWDAIASQVAQRLRFSEVMGIPTGGLKMAAALEPYCTEGPLLLVDDVLTTGRSMEEERLRHFGEYVQGVVLFSRGECPPWITPFFQWVIGDGKG